MHFLKQHGPSTEVFCLQEMHDTTREYREARHPDEFVCWDLLERTRKVLPHHDGYFARWPDNPHRMSVAMFVRHDVPLHEIGSQLVHMPDDVHETGSAIISPRRLMYVRVGSDRYHPLTVVNYHGMWRDGAKKDTPERIGEMLRLADIVRSLGEPLVLAGDLNLDPDTEAIARLTRDANLHNLVQPAPDHPTGTVHGTRTPLYRHWHDPRYTKNADYMFVSTGLQQWSFGPMMDVASDHAALKLELRGW